MLSMSLFALNQVFAQTYYPPSDLKSINNLVISQHNLKGKIVFLHFWFISCWSCRKEIPALRKLQEKYAKNKQIRFIAISIYDPPEKIQQFIQKQQAFPFEHIARTSHNFSLTHHPGIKGPADEWASFYGIKMYPTSILFNKSGKIILRKNGNSEDPFKFYDAAIQKLL